MEGIILKILAASHHLSSKKYNLFRTDGTMLGGTSFLLFTMLCLPLRHGKWRERMPGCLLWALHWTRSLLNLMSLNSPWNSMGLSALSRDELMLGIQTQIALISQVSTFFSAPSGTISGLKVFSSDNGWDYATYSPHHFLSVVIACFLYSELGATWRSSGKGEYKWKRFISSCWKQ